MRGLHRLPRSYLALVFPIIFGSRPGRTLVRPTIGPTSRSASPGCLSSARACRPHRTHIATGEDASRLSDGKPRMRLGPHPT